MFDRQLLALLEGDKKYVAYMVICNLLSTISSITLTFAICHIVNSLILGKTDAASYMASFAAALGGALSRLIFSLLNGRFGAKLGSNVKEILRKRIYQKVARLGVRETENLSLAALTQVGTEGVEQLDLYYSTYLPQFFYSIISPFLLFALLMFISRSTAIVLLCCVPLIPASIVAVSKYARKIFGKYWDRYTKMGDAFLDNISGMKDLKIFGADRRYHEKMNGEAEEFRKITMKVLTMQLASVTIMDLVAYGGAGLGIGVAVAGRMAIHPLFQMETGALLLFIVLIAVDFFLPLRALGSSFHVSMNGKAAGKMILALLDVPEPIWGDKKVSGFDIEMKNVSFSYDGQRQILNDISIQVPPGSISAIVGQSGCGKSTVISLLAGIRRPDSGRITVGGTELSKLSRKDYYLHASVISCDTYLFHDTVRNNFLLANESLTDEEIYFFLRKVNLEEFIRRAGGPDLILNEDSVNISGGQKQRLALAVNLSSGKDIYFFDEITSNIDAESEAIIMDNISELAKTKSVLLISHRLKNVMNAGRIYCLDEGRVAESGTHEELMKADGLYRRLFTRQKNLEEGWRDADG